MAKTHFTIDIPHRQYAEALRDALHSYVVQNTAPVGSLAPDHPMMVWVAARRDELTAAFVEAHA